ncbi:MAG: aminomethyltransferase family protein [Gammaproteobacteria bacterium]|nr:MAG: aminomethyltransferase family protein [Gammaproteobacteria bacterium]
MSLLSKNGTIKPIDFSAKAHYRIKAFPSPFYSRQEPLNELKEWGRWADYLSPRAYYCSSMEYFAARNTCAVFDLTPMTKYRISGTDALPYLNRLVTREVGKIKPGRVGYCVWCTDAGQVIDDGTIFHIREGEYRLCSQERHLDWLLTNTMGFDVSVAEETHQVAALALQGPTSCATLREMGLAGIENMKPFGIGHFPFEDTQLMVSRTGFTGDLGYELWIEPPYAEALWDRLFEAGRLRGIQPMGDEALAMLRVEAGFIQAGHDFMPAHETVRTSHTRSPFELGLSWLVDFDKPNFNGRKALLAEQQCGHRYKLVKLDIDGNKPANDSFVYTTRKKFVGTVTSAIWSPSAKASIALASLQTPYGEPGEEFLVEIYYQKELKWSRVMARAHAVPGVFYDPPRKRLTPAADY